MELESILDRFEARGIELVGLSCNTKEVAERSVSEWGIEKLPIGYGLSIEDARRWGLFVSAAAKETEPDHFVEPGFFIVRPNGELYASSVQTMPFSRPPGVGLLKTLEWIIDNDYPARGEA